MKYLFLFLSAFLLFTSCNKNESHTKVFQAEVSAKVNELYKLDKSDNRYSPPKNLFSPELEKLLNESTKITATDTEKIKKSNHPTDMPLMLVSHLMTNLQDTETGFKIKEINVNGNNAEAFTEFYYDNDPKLTLKIKMLLMNEGGWKIKNIIYNKDSDLKATLESFIQFSKEQS